MLFEGLEHIVREQEPMARYTWFRLGGAAEYFAEPTNRTELLQIIEICRTEDIPIRMLGGGSKVLVRDEGVPGVVVRLSAPAFCEITVNDAQITAGGGARLGHLVSTAVRDGLSGLEQLVGIPGTVGGAVRGNVGANHGDIGQYTIQVEVLTRAGDIKTRDRSELRFAYRKTNIDELVLLSATFALEREEPHALAKRMQKLWILQKAAQPDGNFGMGAIFKDSGGSTAASLIEQAGLKGTRVGDAKVNDRHPNFIEVHPGASAQDVIRLIDLLRTRVFEQLGVELEQDVEIW
ncbi:MAG: UDP-N-acetylmuramate dehydrogenase [Planctomycetales bacterium]|nr:UDP-N-acetylmuramate dehydrogenase [Planctomycetales bacterium]